MSVKMQRLRKVLLSLMLVIGFVAASVHAGEQAVHLTGHQWIRANPPVLAGILIGGGSGHAVNTTEEIEEYFGAWFNYFSTFDPSDRVTLDLARSVDPNCGAFLWSQYDTGVQSYKDTYGVNIPTVIMRGDEPHRSAFAGVAADIVTLKANFPEYLIMCNANPSTANGNGDATYLSDFVDIVDPDVLMSDCYPLQYGGATDFGYYFNLLSEMRKVAIVKDLPLWFWIQSETKAGGYVAINGRLPSETDMRMMLFGAMTFGFTGFNFLSYAHWIVPAVIDKYGVPTHVYPTVKKVNPEALTLLNTLKYAKTTGIFYVPGQPANTVPQYNGPIDLDLWTAAADPDTHIVDVSIDENGTLINGLIGFFNADDAQEYFMICNLNSGVYLSTTEAQVTYRVQFDATVNSLLRMNRITGQQEVVTLTGNELVDLLPGGTGNLYKYDNGTPFLAGNLDIFDCQYAQERGYDLSMDTNNDCYVNSVDMMDFLQDWLYCIEPGIAGCDEPWLP